MVDPGQMTNADAVARRFDLSGKTALVTGGSLSIGRAIALGLAEAGADIAIHFSRRADAALGHPGAAEAAQTDIRARGRRAGLVDEDLCHAGAGTRTAAAATNALGRLDILVICASVQSQESFFDIDPELLERQINVNFKATIQLLQAALPGMLSRKWGRVLSIGSINQTRPSAHLSIYAALKAAQHNLIINLAKQHASDGITANTLSPGSVATERNKWRRNNIEEWANLVKRANPMHRAADAEEMVGAALLLCSDAGSFITGADIQVDGGAHL